MNVKDLIRWLQDFPEDYEVAVLSQPSYPLKHSIDNITDSNSVRTDEEKTVFIALNEPREYGPKDAWS